MSTVFHLEGKLAGPWVDELEASWRTATSGAERFVRVLLQSVTFIDERGKRLLDEMHRHGAELVAEGCMIKAIVEKIAGRERKAN